MWWTLKVKSFVVRILVTVAKNDTNSHSISALTLAKVSQFTLMANTKKGSKPDFHAAAKPETAKELYDVFVAKVRSLYEADKIKDGVFQAMMDVELINDGPVGVDYRSDDSAVSNVAKASMFQQTSSCSC